MVELLRYTGMVGYLLYAQVLFYLWQMLALILGIATLLISLYIVVGLLLLKRTRRGEDDTISSLPVS